MKKILVAFAIMTSLMSSAQTLMGGGTNSKHLKIIFVAEGYQASEEAAFISKAWDGYTALATFDPLNESEFSGTIGYYHYFLPSVDSGVGILAGPGIPAVTKNTRWGFHFNHGGMERLLWTDDTKRLEIENHFKSFAGDLSSVQIVMICNTDTYGGAGELSGEPTEGANPLPVSRKTVLSSVASLVNWNGFANNNDIGTTSGAKDNCFEFLVRHETIGHAIGDLDDEYDLANPHDDPTRPNKHNVTNEERVGLLDFDKFPYEGARYTPVGKWRREWNGLMRGSYDETGTASYRHYVWPTTVDGHTKDNIRDRIRDDLELNTNAVYIEQYGSYDKSTACGKTDLKQDIPYGKVSLTHL